MAKLLIVDDSTMLRDMLNYALNEGGYTDVVLNVWFIGLVEKIKIKIVATDSSVTAEITQ